MLSKITLAQDGPDVVGLDTLQPKYKKVMIIPFEPDWYVCGVQPYLAAASGKTHNEIVDFFRRSVALELQNQFLYLYNTASLIHHSDTNKDIFKAYDAIKYKFIIAPPEEVEEESRLDLAKSFLKAKPRSDKYKRGSVEGGNIVSEKNTEQKIATVVVKNVETIKYLSEKYKTDLFVYITEMDIQNDISDQNAFINNEYERYLRLHFSMVDKEGKVLKSGMVYIKFPNTVNDINVIRSEYLPLVAKKLTNELPQPQKPKVEKGKAVNVNEKIKN